MPIVLRLLGHFALANGSGDLLTIKGARAQLLLARLALPGGVALDRSILSNMLWGERAEEQARASLRPLIWTLRAAVKDYPDALVVDGPSMRLDPAAVRIDVADFDRLAVSDDLGELVQALALYRGDLVDGIDLITLAPDRYLLHERNRLHDLALQVTGTLVERFCRNGQLEPALRATRRGLSLEPFDELLQNRLIDLLQNLGRHRKARDQDEAFRMLMKSPPCQQELDI